MLGAVHLLSASNVTGAPTIRTVATSADFSKAAQGFAFPHIGGDHIMFSAYGNVGESLVQVRGSKLMTVASSEPQEKFTSVQSPTSTSQAVAFVGATPSSSSGLYLTSYPFASIKSIASAGSGFADVASPSLERDNVAFTATHVGLAGIFAARATTTEGSAKLAVHTLVNVSREQPHQRGASVAKLRCLMDPSISRANVVAFFGSDCRTAERGDPSRMYRTQRLSDHALHGDPADASVVGGIYLAHLPAAGAAWPAAGEAALTVVADSTMAAPGSSKTTFVAFSSPVVSEALVAFVASTSDGALGVFTYDLADQSLRKICDTQTKVPGGGGRFSDFPYPPSVAGRTTVFYAAAGGATSGLFAHTHSSRSDGAALRKLVTMGDAINGEAISFLGAGAASSDASTAAFYAVTTVAGIYSVPI